MTEQELETISMRAEKATPGPWITTGDKECTGYLNLFFYDENFKYVVGHNEKQVSRSHFSLITDLMHLEGFNQEFITHARTDVPALVAALREANATITRIAAIHRRYSIYQECGHDHEPDEQGVIDVDAVGLVCAEGKMYDVCGSCCSHDFEGGQDMECAENHLHSEDEAICPTFIALHAVRDKSDNV